MGKFLQSFFWYIKHNVLLNFSEISTRRVCMNYVGVVIFLSVCSDMGHGRL